MSTRGLLALLAAALLVAFVGSCGKKGTEGGLKVTAGLAARVGDTKITEKEMEQRFNELPEQQQKAFKGREGKAAFVDKLIEQQLLYHEALADGLDKDDDVQRQIAVATENILVGNYFSKKIQEKVKVTDKDIENYYHSHEREFMSAPVLRAQWLFTADSLKAVGWLKKLRGGANFGELAKNESEDKTTAYVGGDLGYFNAGGYVKGVGTSAAFSAAVDTLRVNGISPILHLEKGYGIVKLTERNPSKLQALSDVTKLIEGAVTREKTQEAFSAEVDRLKKKYPNENYVREMLKESTRSPEELWEMAQLEDDPNKRIEYYREIVNLYPQHKNAPQALFMIGFVYAEDLQDFPMARRAFDELQQKYPESDMNESAKWMRENMTKPRPRFDSVEKMEKAMEQEKSQTGTKGE
jgi:peptidyl-prolyl cis-trans isomerase C